MDTDSSTSDSYLAAEVRLRQFALADEMAVLALWRQVFPDDPPHHDPRESIRLKLTEQPELFFVALHDAEMVGTIMAGYDGHRGWIYRVAVDPRYQRQGIGTALVRHAEAALVARGAPKINLQVLPSNAQVVAFYEQLGYVVEPRVSLGKRVC